MNFTSNEPLAQLLHVWKNEPTISDNIIHWEKSDSQPGRYAAFPFELHPAIITALKHKGIESLYSHQLISWDLAESGQNYVVVTSTASGKSLCYNLPILNACLNSPTTRALYLYPTKALAQDQFKTLATLQTTINEQQLSQPVLSGIYDGDTPTSQRSTTRAKANIILTNPDMLHISLLPHHTIWMEFFRTLRFVVIDEMHIYRGVFGSHLANILRRLKRVANFYGSKPQFILTSATIANPIELAEKLTEENVSIVDEDGAPKGQRHFLFYNPPVINPEVGVRKSASSESIRLANDLLRYRVQTIIFTRSRRSVELILRNFRSQVGVESKNVRGYRSGYLPRERRQIEQELRSGQAKVVVATNALELGIDIGNMDAAILVGYPGSIAATRQQAGRAGRRNASSLSIMVASAGPLDQYLMNHPEHILGRSPEQALIDPDNLLILLQHLRCAAFELPFEDGQPFGKLSTQILKELILFLTESGDLHKTNGKYFWLADQYPSNQVSLRTSSPNRVRLLVNSTEGEISIGEVDQPSAMWLTHPGAIYLHESTSYEVVELDLNQHAAMLRRVDPDYFTEPVRKTTIEQIQKSDSLMLKNAEKCYGEVMVTSQTVGFRRLRWNSNEVIDQEVLDLPAVQLRTTAYWITLSADSVTVLKNEGLWVNDHNNYGLDWNRQRNLTRKRDQYICQLCGVPETGEAHHVHHKTPFRSFTSYSSANQIGNLITLCASCHKKAEQAVRMRSGLAGLAYLIHHLTPLFVMCDINDIGVDFDPQSTLSAGNPTICVYDQIPAGIGLSKRLYEIQDQIFENAYQVIDNCQCNDGCPSCVGPAGENGIGGKVETKAILIILTGKILNGIAVR